MSLLGEGRQRIARRLDAVGCVGRFSRFKSTLHKKRLGKHGLSEELKQETENIELMLLREAIQRREYLSDKKEEVLKKTPARHLLVEIASASASADQFSFDMPPRLMRLSKSVVCRRIQFFCRGLAECIGAGLD